MIEYLGEIAYDRSPGEAPGVMFLGGFRSDMTGNKVLALESFCREQSRAFVRFDYFAHGASAGDFADATMTRWISDALDVLDTLTEGPQILVGSSMGGWIMTHLALKRPQRVKALVGIAAAPDFVGRRMLKQMSPQQQRELQQQGVIYVPNDEGKLYPITQALIDSGLKEAVFPLAPIPVRCPVRLLQGTADDVVPERTAYEFAEALETTDVQVTLIRQGDHRLSREEDITLLCETVESLIRTA